MHGSFERVFGDRRKFIKNSGARFVFTDADTGIAGTNVVSCELHYSDRARPADEDFLYHRGAPLTSTYLALEVAAYMGAALIGLIGVDLCGGYFFDRADTQSKLLCGSAESDVPRNGI